MATVTVVKQTEDNKVIGVFSDYQVALNYCDYHDPGAGTSGDEELDTETFELDGLVDDENKPELPSNHPLWNK